MGGSSNSNMDVVVYGEYDVGKSTLLAALSEGMVLKGCDFTGIED